MSAIQLTADKQSDGWAKTRLCFEHLGRLLFNDKCRRDQCRQQRRNGRIQFGQEIDALIVNGQLLPLKSVLIKLSTYLIVQNVLHIQIWQHNPEVRPVWSADDIAKWFRQVARTTAGVDQVILPEWHHCKPMPVIVSTGSAPHPRFGSAFAPKWQTFCGVFRLLIGFERTELLR